MTGLFDDDYTQSAEASVALDRLQERQLTDVTQGVHPLTGRTDIHARADLDASPADPPDLPYRCGTCRYRTDDRWPKCQMNHQDRSPATDVKAWWPACHLYEVAA